MVKSSARSATALLAAFLLAGVLAMPASAAVQDESPLPLSLRSFGHWVTELVAQTFDGL